MVMQSVFGLAKLMQPGDTGATRSARDTEPGMIMGTVSYTSPEQCEGNRSTLARTFSAWASSCERCSQGVIRSVATHLRIPW